MHLARSICLPVPPPLPLWPFSPCVLAAPGRSPRSLSVCPSLWCRREGELATKVSLGMVKEVAIILAFAPPQSITKANAGASSAPPPPPAHHYHIRHPIPIIPATCIPTPMSGDPAQNPEQNNRRTHYLCAYRHHFPAAILSAVFRPPGLHVDICRVADGILCTCLHPGATLYPNRARLLLFVQRGPDCGHGPKETQCTTGMHIPLSNRQPVLEICAFREPNLEGGVRSDVVHQRPLDKGGRGGMILHLSYT